MRSYFILLMADGQFSGRTGHCLRAAGHMTHVVMLLCLDSAQIRLSPKPGASDGYKVPTHIKDQRFVVDNIGIKNIFFFTVFLSLLMDGGASAGLHDLS